MTSVIDNALKRALDLGAHGVVVPWVSGRAECEAAVRACKYPPEGIRGMAGSHRAAGFGRFGPEYWKRANAEVLVVVQIETADAVKDIDAMLAVPGVDVAFVGPMVTLASDATLLTQQAGALARQFREHAGAPGAPPRV